MNGRVYDPQLGRFLSADPFIQFADNSQSYSRYSYVLNNPLSSTDPSGHFAFLPVLINVAVTMASEAGAEAIAWNIAATTAISTTEMAVIQTAIQAGLSGLAQGIAAEAMGGTFAQGFEAGVLSGVQSGIYDGIGGAESLNGTQIPGLGAGITVERVLAHGLVGGAFARVRGDSFESGFASGVFSKLTAGRIQENISNKYGGAAASVMIGGTASVIAGGKFANGAVSSAFAHLFSGGGVRQQQASGSSGGGFFNGILDVVGKIWSLPNTIAGLAYGSAGHVAGWIKGINPKIKFGHNAMQFINNPFIRDNEALTLGNTILYGSNSPPWKPGAYGDNSVNIGFHEEAHTYQYQALGLFYAPVYLLNGRFSGPVGNPLEQAAQVYGRNRGQGGWWPW